MIRLITLILLLSGFASNNVDKKDLTEIHWSDKNHLKWSDFRGEPIADSEFIAQTVSVIEQSYACNGDDFKYDIVTKFNCIKSWTKVHNNPKVLQHEQKHFDLTEIYARKIRKAYATLENPCNYSIETLGLIYDKYILKLKQMQQLYDIETDHGLNKPAQYYWNDKIKTGLEHLKEYK